MTFAQVVAVLANPPWKKSRDEIRGMSRRWVFGVLFWSHRGEYNEILPPPQPQRPPGAMTAAQRLLWERGWPAWRMAARLKGG